MMKNLKKFGMENSKPVSIPMAIVCHLSKDNESLGVDQTLYRSMIGGWLYLTASNSISCMQHAWFLDIKLILSNLMTRLLKEFLIFERNLGLWLVVNRKGSDFCLKTHTIANWSRYVDDRRNTNGSAFFLGDKLVYWFTKKQDSRSLSIIKAKYIVVASCCTQVM